MKCSTTLGLLATTGLLVGGGLSAAHATSESFDQTPAQCSAAVADGDVVIEIPSPLTYTQVIVKVSGVPLDSSQFVTTDAQIRIDLEDAVGAIDVELRDEDATVAQCQAPQPPASSPTATASSPPETPQPAPVEPSEEASQQPGASPRPEITTPAPTPTEEASPAPVPPAPSVPDRTTNPPDMSYPVTEPAAPAPETTTEAPSEQQRLSQSTPLDTPRGPRIIRSLPENPRYLLPQLLGFDTQQGSRLVLPHPRAAGEPPPELETLPPISEDELRALKAQIAIPDATQSSSISAQSPTAGRDAGAMRQWGWLFTGFIAISGAAATGWWLVARRNREH